MNLTKVIVPKGQEYVKFKIESYEKTDANQQP